MKRKFIIIGKKESGKSTIANLIEEEIFYKKFSQDPYYREKTVEIPAMYLENPWMHNVIYTISQNHGLALIFVLDARDKESIYPPAYAKSFSIPKLGIITNVDKVSDKELKFSEHLLKEAGLNQILEYDSNKDVEEEKIKRWIEKTEIEQNARWI